MPHDKERRGEPLRAVVGRRVRALREQAGVRQDDIAVRARLLGLNWTRSTVAALERGEKAISIEELVLLTTLLNAALGRHYGQDWITVAELFDDDADVRLSAL